jgi:hypothetical protein
MPDLFRKVPFGWRRWIVGADSGTLGGCFATAVLTVEERKTSFLAAAYRRARSTF